VRVSGNKDVVKSLRCLSLRYYYGNSGQNHFRECHSIILRRWHKDARYKENCPRFPAFLEEFPEHKAQLVPRLRGMRGWNDPARRYFMTRTREHGETRTTGMIFGNGCRSHERNGSVHNDAGTRARNERFIKINWTIGNLPREWAPTIKHTTRINLWILTKKFFSQILETLKI